MTGDQGAGVPERKVVATALELLAGHSVLSLATLFEGQPHATSLMYAHDGFDLFWVSDPKTRHGRAVAADPRVAVTIARQYEDFTRIRGLQMTGTALRIADREQAEQALALLGQRFAFIRLFRKGPQRLRERLQAVTAYRFEAAAVTLIDNTEGFGYKRTFCPPR
jgi:uncharacterized protein YhbP (UPF0306 family)